MKICLVCSSGGHFQELYRLKSAWADYDVFWVTFSGPDTLNLLHAKKMYAAHAPTNRSMKNLLRNLFLAWRILKQEKPDVIVSTGAGVCVPFFIFGRLRGIKTVYIESLARINELSLTGRLLYRIAHTFVVQWPQLTSRHKRAVYRGQVL